MSEDFQIFMVAVSICAIYFSLFLTLFGVINNRKKIYDLDCLFECVCELFIKALFFSLILEIFVLFASLPYFFKCLP